MYSTSQPLSVLEASENFSWDALEGRRKGKVHPADLPFLKHCCQCMNLVQLIILTNLGHNRQVGEGHDTEVKKWQINFTQTLIRE